MIAVMNTNQQKAAEEWNHTVKSKTMQGVKAPKKPSAIFQDILTPLNRIEV